MDEDTYAGLSGVGIGAAVSRGEVRAVDVVRVALGRVARRDGELCAFLEVWAEEAVERAREVDRRVAAGAWLPLAGVPVGVKGWRGARTVVARRLVEAGCVPVGATSVPEPGTGTAWQTWGQGSGGRTVNPWRRDRTPGGSSAGSAVAVAAGMVPLATGGDGAGSVRIPAAWCGVFGLKLGHGAGGRLVAPGVLARGAGDVGAYLGCVVGGGSRSVGRTPVAVWSADLGFAGHEVEPEVAAVARDAAERLAADGAVRIVRPPEPVRLDDPGPAWLALRTPGADPAAATRTREANDERLAAFFREADLLLTPATPNRPHGHEGPGERYSTALTWAFNLSGHPAASIPAGRTADGCPVGLQLVARSGEEALLVDVMRAVERHGRVLA